MTIHTVLPSGSKLTKRVNKSGKQLTNVLKIASPTRSPIRHTTPKTLQGRNNTHLVKLLPTDQRQSPNNLSLFHFNIFFERLSLFSFVGGTVGVGSIGSGGVPPGH
jgi:hypothetical protein